MPGDMKQTIELLNTLSPIGVIGLLSYIVYLLVSRTRQTKEAVQRIGDNHLHDLPLMALSLQRMETVLEEIRDGINILRERPPDWRRQR